MIYGVYAIRDLKTTFMSPIISQNDAEAGRNFSHAVMQTDSLYYTHASDFDLFKIGSYDSETGIITGMNPEIVLSGYNVKGALEHGDK